MTLLQVSALGGGLDLGVGRDRLELAREPGDEVGELALAPPDLLQLFDEAGAFPVSFFEEPAKHESETARAVIPYGSHKGGDL